MKRFKTFFSLALIGAILLSMLNVSTSKATVYDPIDFNMLVDQAIQSHITIKGNLIVVDNEKALFNELEEIKINLRNAPYNPLVLLETILNNIEIYNEQIASGLAILLSDGAIIDATSDTLYLQGGSTYDVKYYWGVRRYLSTASANEMVRDLNKESAATAAMATIAGIASAEFAGLAAIPFVGYSLYASWIASDMSYVNGLTNDGVIADFHYTFYYNIRTQSNGQGVSGDGHSHSGGGRPF